MDDFDIRDENCSELLKISLQNLLEDLRSYEFNNDLQVMQKYIDVLMRDDEYIIEFEEPNYVDILNECMQWMNNYVFHLTSGSAAENIEFRKLLFLLSEKRLNVLEEGNLEANELRLSLVNNGCKIIKLLLKESFENAEYYICRTEQELKKLLKFCDEGGLSNRQILHKKTELIMYRIEKMMKENKTELALEELNRQKDSFLETEKYRKYYVALCYNVSLKFKTVENYDYFLTGLLLAYDACKISDHLSEDMKIALNCLVCICLKYEPHKNWEHALRALELTNKNEVSMFYIMGKMKLSLVSQQKTLLDDTLNQAAKWKHIKAENINQIVEFLEKNGLSPKAADFLRNIRCLPFSANDKFSLAKREVQLYISENDRRVFSLIENCIEMTIKNDIAKASVIGLYELLLSHATIQFKKSAFKESLHWYTYCTQLCQAAELEERLLHHARSRICQCYLEMNEWKLAKQTFALLKDPNGCRTMSDPFYDYLALQIAFVDENEALVEETLIRYSDYRSGEKIGDILLSCCHKALQSGKKEILIKVLETVLMKYKFPEESILLAKLSQSLIAVYADSAGEKDIQEKYLMYLDKALNAIQNNAEGKETEELSQWFSRAAWNLALTPDIEPKYMFEYFLRCCCFSEVSARNLNRLKNSLMLAAASGLYTVREIASLEEKTAVLRKVITVIEKCKSLETGTNVTLLRLLYLYEFEAKCHLNELNEEMDTVKEILHLPFMDIKTLEHIAAIVNEFSRRNYEIIVESLKVAVQKFPADHQGSSSVSKTYHCLIQVLFNVQEYISPSVEEENLKLCNNILQLIEDYSDYPEFEILWLMTKCWNWGIHKLTQNDMRSAYKWCTLAKNFLQKLKSFKMLYEKKLIEMYSIYFSDQNEQQIPENKMQ